MFADLLDQPHLSIIGASHDCELDQIASTVERSIVVDGRAQLESTLCELLSYARPGASKTLDLIGHSTMSTSLLVLGEWVIDARSPTVTAFFRELAEQEVLPRLGITAVRLLGCLTADTAHGKWTIAALADVLGVEVYGTTGLLLASHYDRDGFADARRYLLASATDLRTNGVVPRPLDRGEPSGFVLDVDALPPRPLDTSRSWPVHVASHEEARELLYLVRRRDGSQIPGLQAAPDCEIALPSQEPGRYHLIQVMLDAEVVRVHPRGAEHGIVYPVDDPFTLRQLIASLASTGRSGSPG
jgi:hypothetical protein